MGSPSLLVSHPPPNPLHKVLPAAGPYRRAPVALSNTAKDSLTHCTYWVAPMAPLVSGGTPSTVKFGKPFPTPRMFTPAEVATADWTPSVCSTGSCAGPWTLGCGISSSRSWTCLGRPESLIGGTSRSGAETSWCTSADTRGVGPETCDLLGRTTAPAPDAPR